jgi:hypothetical protein
MIFERIKIGSQDRRVSDKANNSNHGKHLVYRSVTVKPSKFRTFGISCSQPVGILLKNGAGNILHLPNGQRNTRQRNFFSITVRTSIIIIYLFILFLQFIKSCL